MQKKTKRYIVVDDDPVSNLVSELNIKKFDPEAELILFTCPEEALEFLKSEKDSQPSILLLDINMPIMTGWEFLSEFNQFPQHMRESFSVFILSSSLEDCTEKVETYPDLNGFFSKPLGQKHFEEMKLKI